MSQILPRLPWESPYGTRAKEDPFGLFTVWHVEASSGTDEPSVGFLATATRRGAPSCRPVMLKEYSENGFDICTNTHSRKCKDIQGNPQAALCFYWPSIQKQIRIEGYTADMPDEKLDAHFAGAPAKVKIGAWASRQSEPLQDQGELLRGIAQHTARWAAGGVKRPPHWGGIRIVPDYFEFRQETGLRIPQRKVFYLREDAWYVTLLYP
ncbi:MAG: pyridoxal 5'-phosphate synthase [Alphaproteobacteria bacterium]|nr:pyridoxal 5'-phosphate synthase [Alphaproteobacteria bacterium]